MFLFFTKNFEKNGFVYKQNGKITAIASFSPFFSLYIKYFFSIRVETRVKVAKRVN